MKSARQSRVCIAGAGVLGLATAATLARYDIEVLLLDPDLDALNASAVAAGLLAPIGEVLFDPAAAAHYPILYAARRLWDAFAARFGIELVTEGALIPVDRAEQARSLGATVKERGALALIDVDLQVADPAAALRTLQRAVLAAGGRIERRAVAERDWTDHDAVVLAVGAQSRALAAAAPELRHLHPVKGQIAILPNGPKVGPALRWAGGYLAPQASGARVGATMQVGRDDIAVEPAEVARLAAAALAHAPDLDVSGAYGQAGVRMQTPDGLPLVGPSSASGTLIAAGARRNGWLLAPLVARIIAAYCRGEDAGPWAELLHPARFD